MNLFYIHTFQKKMPSYSSVFLYYKILEGIEKCFNVFSVLRWCWEKSRAIVLKLVNPSLCFTFTPFCPINCTLKIFCFSFPLIYQNSSKNWAKRVVFFSYIYFFLTPKHVLTFKERRKRYLNNLSSWGSCVVNFQTTQMAQTSSKCSALNVQKLFIALK